MKQLWRLAGVLAAVGLAATACTTSDKVEARAAVSGARPGGVLRVAIEEPGSIDPGNAYDPSGRLIAQTMCDPLIQFDPVTGEATSAIAESWQISKRGSKFTMRIRPEARFSNGDRVTADDVVFTLSRLASEEFASFESRLVAPVKGFEFVHGDTDTDDEDRRRKLKGIKVIEGNSFEIETAIENADWVRVLGHAATSPVSRKLAQRDPGGFERQPVCVGPYRVADPWSPGDTTIVLERSETYRPLNGAYTRAGQGWADRIEFHVKPDLNAQAEAWIAGEVDVARLPRERLAELSAAFGPHILSVPTPTIDYVGLPTGDGRFKDPAIRTALSLALDRRAVVETLYGGGRRPATGFLPPTLGHELYREHACAETVPETPDVERARSILADAGVDLPSEPLSFSFNDEYGNCELAEVVAQQWRDAFGVVVELNPMPWQKYRSAAAAAEGFDGAFRVSWSSTYPSADQYLAPVFSSGGVGRDNFSRYSDPGFDLQLERTARRTLDEESRNLEYLRLEDQLCTTMPLIPVTFDVDQYLVRAERIARATDELASSGGYPALRELYLRG